MRKTLLFFTILGLILVMTSCQKSEEATVSKYFQAMVHKDKATMATMALEPRSIEYKAFEIVSIEEPVEVDLQFPDLVKKMKDLEAQKQVQGLATLDKNDEFEEAQDEYNETRRRSKKIELKKKIDQLKIEFEEAKQKVLILQKKISKVKKEIEREKALIALSTDRRGDLSLYTGKTKSTKVTVKVTLQNDEIKNYIILLREDSLTLENQMQQGRLIIIKLMTEEEYEQSLTEAEEVTEEKPVTEENPSEEETPQ